MPTKKKEEGKDEKEEEEEEERKEEKKSGAELFHDVLNDMEWRRGAQALNLHGVMGLHVYQVGSRFLFDKKALATTPNRIPTDNTEKSINEHSTVTQPSPYALGVVYPALSLTSFGCQYGKSINGVPYQDREKILSSLFRRVEVPFKSHPSYKDYSFHECLYTEEEMDLLLF